MSIKRNFPRKTWPAAGLDGHGHIILFGVKYLDMIVGIILAGGRGKRFGSEESGVNKTAASLSGKPLVVYGVELFFKTTDKTVVVVGSMAETVKAAVGEYNVEWATQEKPLGTGDAVRAGVYRIKELGWKVKSVVVGYADHMMFYTPAAVKSLVDVQQKNDAVMGLLATEYQDPNKLAWGRLIRSTNGDVERIVEQKNATEEEKNIKEVNPGFYCFDYKFLLEAVDKIKPNTVNGEYYITDLVEIAGDMGKKVVAVRVPFEEVGYGINTREELEADRKMMIQ